MAMFFHDVMPCASAVGLSTSADSFDSKVDPACWMTVLASSTCQSPRHGALLPPTLATVSLPPDTSASSSTTPATTVASSAAGSTASSPNSDQESTTTPCTSVCSSICELPSPAAEPPISRSQQPESAKLLPQPPAVPDALVPAPLQPSRKELPPSAPTLKPTRSFSSSRNNKLRVTPQDVPRQTLLKALVSARPALTSIMSPGFQHPLAPSPLQPGRPILSPVELHSALVESTIESTLSPPTTAKYASGIAPLQSPCFYHQRFDPAVNVERVLEEIAGDEFRSHSRLVQTALGVREVARQLQRRTCKTTVRNIMIVTKARDNQLVTLTRELAEWIMSTPRYGAGVGINVYVDKKLRDSKRFNAAGLIAQNPEFQDMLKYWTPDLCWTSPETFDLVLTLGGDGTVLFTSWLFQRIVPPILSFSLGSLGFLTNFKYNLYHEILENILTEGMRVNMRMRFTCTVYRAEAGKSVETDQFEVLNELVIDRGPSPYVSNLELYGDDELLTVVQADGCIFSTPTGSTAYSLSAGGSLVHPDIPAILLTPICPHTLSFRPMLLNDSMLLRIAVPTGSRATAWCAFDGKGRIELRQGDFVTIAASQYPFPTVLSNSTEWIDSISRTLRWNTRGAQQKAWDSGDAEEENDEPKWDIDTDSGVYNSDSEEDANSPVGRKMALLGMM